MTSQNRSRLVTLSDRIRLLSSESRQTLLAYNSNLDLRKSLMAKVREHELNLNRFLALLDQELLQSGHITIQPDDYFSAGTLAISSALKILHAALTAGKDRLNAKTVSLSQKKSLLQFTSLIIILIAAYLLAAFYLYVMRTVANLDDSAKRMLAGDMSAPVTVDGHDELGQVVHSFNKIATALVASSAHLKAVVDYSLDGIITTDKTGAIRSFNPAAEKIFGYAGNEAIGENIKMLMPESYHAAHDRSLKRNLKTGESRIIGKVVEVEGQRRDGGNFPLELAVNDMRVGGKHLLIGTLRDITNRKQMEKEKLRLAEASEQSQWLESLGTLAGGIAHDFNNLLTAIMGNASLAGMKLDNKSPVKKRLAIIEESSQKAADLCRQMLAYSGKG